jgi:hypothetical protein
VDWQEAARIAQDWKAAMPRIDVTAQQTRDVRWAVVVAMEEGFEIYSLTHRAARRLYARWWRVQRALANAAGLEQKPLGL